jgi:hypothetical protein
VSGRSVFGKGPTAWGPGTGGGISTARFTVLSGGTEVPFNTPTEIVWDTDDAEAWNGVSGLSLSGTTFTFPAGRFFIAAFADLGPVGCSPGWSASLEIYPSNAELVTEIQTSVAGPENAQMCASGVHAMADGDTLTVVVRQYDSSAAKSVNYAILSVLEVG